MSLSSRCCVDVVCPVLKNLPEIEMDFVVPLKDVSVPEKKQAKFECTITKDVAKVMWHRGDDVITSDQKYDIIDDGKKHMLVINCCEFEDEDNYTVAVLGKTSMARLTVEGKCCCRNAIGQPSVDGWPCPLPADDSCDAATGIRLKVVSPLRDQTVKEGATARFELELSHDDIPVTWYRNEVKVHPSRTVLTLAEGHRHVLEIKDTTLDDICQVKAEAKGIPCMANLTVIGQ